MTMLDLFQEIFNLVVIIRFISINNCPIGKRIGIRLSGIDITKVSRSQEAFNRLPILGDYQMNLYSIKVAFLTRLIASKRFIGVNLGTSNPYIVTHSNWQTINHIDRLYIECFPYLCSQVA